MKKVLRIAVIILIILTTEIFLGRYVDIISQATEIEQNYEENNKEIYDVILFWGQSNMVGYCGSKEENDEDKQEKRYSKEQIKEFSRITGISTKILNNATAVNHVNVDIERNIAFEYKYSKNGLEEITPKTKTLGENIEYNTETKKIQLCERKSTIALEESYGTNLVPQFCADYYKSTGHKVVAVVTANSGEEIAHFLPNKESNKYSLSTKEERKNQYIYEAMTQKYNSAINFLEENGYNIGNKLYVVFQGESDVGYIEREKQTSEDYIYKFQKIHNYLKRDCGITLGAIIETSKAIGEDFYEGVKGVHYAQEYLIKNNKDIILATRYSYKHYVPSEEVYESKDYVTDYYINNKGEKIDYDKAYLYASYSMCLKKPKNNIVHFTSAALSQIGKEAAESVAKYYKQSIEQEKYKLGVFQNKEIVNVKSQIEVAYIDKRYY